MGKFRSFQALLFTIVLSFGLAGCGGGDDVFSPGGDSGDGTGGGGGTTGTLSIALSLVEQATGNTTTSISATSPGELRATVTLDGSPLASEVVSFSTTLGSITPSAGTALTNISGVATVVLSDSGVAGAGVATAEVTVNGVTAETSLNFQILAGSVPTTTVDMGNGTGAAFVPDVIDIGGITTLAAGGTLTATVDVVETSNANAAYGTPVSVAFSSTCVVAGTASMDSPVTTVNGRASSTYLAQGCTGSDTITATADIGGTTYSATANLTIQAADVGSIEFVSANPENIALQGTGGTGRSETSVVTFRVVDAQGNPVANQTVNFGLSTVVGGISLSPTSATSDQNGLVQTVVQSGTVATSVGVTATTSSGGNTYQTQSSSLVITTGIPDQDSFSLSATTLTPEAWGHDGVISQITARLADRFNNPVPDGTAVTFTTEGGSIDGSCTTVDGECSVTWRSQLPRPCGQTIGDSEVVLNPLSGPNVCEYTGGPVNSGPQAGFAPLGQPYGGRATIVATVVGEESFIDTNGNGVFDDGDTATDLPEAWRDENEDGVRGAYEPFVDFNSNGMYDAADGEFNGVLCNRTVAPLCSTNQSLSVRSSLVLVMSGSSAYVDVIPSTLDLSCKASVPFVVRYSDLHNQPMPAGTVVTVKSSLGTVEFGGTFTQADTSFNGAVAFSGSLKGKGEAGVTNTGVLTVEVETPKGLITTWPFSVTETCP
jgi:hypothetical protein